MSADHCAHCKAPVNTSEGPPATVAWCSDACLAAWEAEDPKRSEGWVSVGDLTAERRSELFEASGMSLESSRPIGKVVLS